MSRGRAPETLPARMQRHGFFGGRMRRRLANAVGPILYLTLLAVAFMGLGIWVGASLFRRSVPPAQFQTNSKARQALGISDREFQVLCLLTEGRSNKEVATLLDVGVSTVETHRGNLMQKLSLHNTAEIVLYAVRKGLIV